MQSDAEKEKEKEIFEAMIRIASENYTANPLQVLFRARHFFKRALQIHGDVLRKMIKDKNLQVDVNEAIREVIKGLEKEVTKGKLIMIKKD
jgi:hypothetical protein